MTAMESQDDGDEITATAMIMNIRALVITRTMTANGDENNRTKMAVADYSHDDVATAVAQAQVAALVAKHKH